MGPNKQVAGLLSLQCQIEMKPIPPFKTVERPGQYTLFLNRYSFLDYLKADLEIHTVCCLDFTKSSTNLHQARLGGSLCENVMHSFTSVLGPYDNDQLFPLYGFGAQLDGSAAPSALFPVNKNMEPDCQGVDGLLQAYRDNLSRMKFGSLSAAPKIVREHIKDEDDEDSKEQEKLKNKQQETQNPFRENDFYQMIDQVIEDAKKAKAAGWFARKYFVLYLVVTGDDFDLEQTNRAIIESSHYPISIILVGVGSNFPNLSKLDADEKPLNYEGVLAKRDIVQFVRYDEKTEERSFGTDLLAEIPYQVCSFMAMHAVQPTTL